MAQRVVIIDDEPTARKAMAMALSDIDDICIIGEAGDGKSAIDLIQQQQPDIVFMDIQMPALNGFQVAQATKEQQYHLVFATAFEHYALPAFETHAVDYLLKPVRPERIRRSIEKIQQLQQPPASSTHSPLNISDGHRSYLLQTQDIGFIEAVGRYRRLHLSQHGQHRHQTQTIITDVTLDHFEQVLDPQGCQRIHRSYLINLQQVTQLQTQDRQTQVALTDYEALWLPVSRSQLASLKSRLHQ